MLHDNIVALGKIRVWVERTVYAFMIALIVIACLILTSVVYRAYFNDPPITLTALDPLDLGEVCPGDEVPINNWVIINKPIIVVYFISTMDIRGDQNYVGTQKAYTDMLHPHATEFKQIIPWQVPDLPPAKYLRVVAARNVTDNEDTVFIQASYSIRADCPSL